jgi:hypothetical protein
MNCEDARELMAAFTSRTIGLTERALLEAHLRQCGECRDVSRPLRTAGPGERNAAPTLAARLRRTRDEATQAGIVGLAHLRAGLRARLLILLAPTAQAARAAARAATAIPLAAGARARDRGARLRRRLPIAWSPAARVAWLGLLAVAGLYALYHRPGLEPDAHREPVWTAALVPSAAPPDVEPPAPAAIEIGESPAPEPAFGAGRSVEPQAITPAEAVIVTAAETQVSQPAEAEVRRPRESEKVAPAVSPAPPIASVQRPEPRKPEPARTPRPAPERAEVVSPEPAQRRVPPMAHVAGSLSVKDRAVVERDLLPLLARTGGTLVGRDRDGAVLFVDAVVPQSGYEEFTRGLTRIGSWRIEAERSPLPEDVHLTIRVGG